MTRQIVRKFNGLWGELFVEPKPLLTQMPRLLGLDGRKMSKSYGNFIALSDEPEVIAKKVQGMFTDPKRIRRTDPGHPEPCNVHRYYEIFFPQDGRELTAACRNAQMGCTDCKKMLAEKLVQFLAPRQEKRREYLQHKKTLCDILEAGRLRAQEAARKTIEEVRSAIGLVSCPTK